MATHSSILAWENPMDRGAWNVTVHGGHKRVGHDLVTKQQQHRFWIAVIILICFYAYFDFLFDFFHDLLVIRKHII